MTGGMKVDFSDSVAIEGERQSTASAVLSAPVTPREAFEAAGLDYTVSSAPVVTPAGKTLAGHRLIVRDDNGAPLGVVKSRYQILNNAEAFLPLLERDGAEQVSVESCGVAEGGAVAWMLLRTRETVEPIAGDPIASLILVATTHNGTRPFCAAATMRRVRCANELGAAIRGACHVVRLKHTKNVGRRATSILDVLNATADYRRRFVDATRAMSRTPVTGEMVERFLAHMFPDSDTRAGEKAPTTATLRARAAVREIFEGEPTTRAAGSTAFGLLNAGTFWAQHIRELRGRVRWATTAFGSGVALRQRAWDAALALVN